ncbi:uclacyanin 1 [Prunus dulcis]|uniref:Uclacyanin 1 n=1 Tax=Prunus dulcis TaxID=3755 RepID=A0A4Y1RGE2_PRUDU|nr:uclacyanin 1 [Prunus dulcis]
MTKEAIPTPISMASSNLYIILATLAVFAPSVLATDYVVGDDKGWTINFDYQAWAQGKSFYVGDNLVFNYPKGAHTVLKVNGTGFQQCAAPLDSVPLTSGKDVINLATPGRKWYICGVAQHCELGNQKLLITVLPSSSHLLQVQAIAHGLMPQLGQAPVHLQQLQLLDKICFDDASYYWLSWDAHGLMFWISI